jgi:protein TonB
LHGGLLYALWSVRVPARPGEAKILFVSLVEPAPAKRTAEPPVTAAPAMPAAAPTPPRPERKAEPAAKPDQAEVVPKPAPLPKSESVPVDAAPAQVAVDATSPAEASAPPASAPARTNDDATGNASGGAPGNTSDGPVALASELALVCSERRAPPYPSVSRRLGEAGRVVLRVELDATGRVLEAQVVNSSGFARLDAAALAAVRNWRCEPPRRDGQAVGAVALQPFDFTLDGP